MQYIQFLGIMYFIIFLREITTADKKDHLSRRKEQSKQMLDENLTKAKIHGLINKATKPSMRRKTEALIAQAGLNIKFEDFIVLSVGVGVLLGFIVGYALRNILMGGGLLILGFFIPTQILGIKKSKRIHKLDDQIGIFMQIATKRYESTHSMYSALTETARELEGEEPIHYELEKTISEIDLTGDSYGALQSLAKRTESKDLEKFAAYHGVTLEGGTNEEKVYIQSQAYKQYEANRAMNRKSKKEVKGIVNTIYLLAAAGLIFMIGQFANEEFVHTIKYTKLGQVGIFIVFLIYFFCMYFTNKKINSPLD